MIITKNGSLIPSTFLGSAGHWMNVVETFVPMISKTEDWMSGSVILLMCPFLTFLSQICSGLDLFIQKERYKRSRIGRRKREES